MEVDEPKSKKTFYYQTELFIFQKYGFTLKTIMDEIHNLWMKNWAETVEEIVDHLADDISEEMQNKIRLNLMDLIVANGKMAYILEKWTDFLFTKICKPMAGLQIQEKTKDAEKTKVQERIEQEKKRILELEMQIQYLKNEKQNVRKLLNAIQEIEEAKNNL
uniref:Uncharacterized protein n=1 Tax=Panagrolaimus sp. JU765 TaxID=591449 RepID=A0AC34R7S3_9BILA